MTRLPSEPQGRVGAHPAIDGVRHRRVAACAWIVWYTGDSTLYLPLLKDGGLALGLFYIAFAAFVIVWASAMR
jgi:hypothetical protein